MSTLGERIDWILKNCRDDSGKKWNAKSLSNAAGLTDAHVGMIKRGTVKNLRVQTLEAIAHAAKVSYRWLGTGEGLPGDPDVPGIEAVAAHQARATYADLPLWPRLLATARILAPHIEEWVWIEVGKANVLLNAPVTAKTLVGVARIVMEDMQPAEATR